MRNAEMTTCDFIAPLPDDAEQLAERFALDRWDDDGGFIPGDDNACADCIPLMLSPNDALARDDDV
jgi:hypothetical protein